MQGYMFILEKKKDFVLIIQVLMERNRKNIKINRLEQKRNRI